MLPKSIRVQEYVDAEGVSPFADWFDNLDPTAAAKVTLAITRLSRGAVGNVKGVGEGVLEFRIDWGPGYRVYFGRDGERLIILVAGGTKRRQGRDIEVAKIRWAAYRARKKGAV